MSWKLFAPVPLMARRFAGWPRGRQWHARMGNTRRNSLWIRQQAPTRQRRNAL